MKPSSLKRNRETYDRLCGIADRLLKRYNPCAGCKGCHLVDPKPYDCCTGCPLLGENGCTTSSLACKLWLCNVVSMNIDKTPDRLMHQLRRLSRIADSLNMRYARATPEEVLAMTEHRDMWYLYHELNRGPRYELPVRFVRKK